MRSELWYNSHTMRNNIFAALAFAVLAGCAPDNGVADYEKGEVAYAARDLPAAAFCYNAAAAKNPTNFMARIKLALVKMDLGEIDAARTAIASAIEIDPDSAEARLIEGNIAYLAKDYQCAKNSFSGIAHNSVAYIPNSLKNLSAFVILHSPLAVLEEASMLSRSQVFYGIQLLCSTHRDFHFVC